MLLSDDDRRAVAALCGGSMVLRDLLAGFPNLDECDDIKCDPNLPLAERIVAFADKLKSYLRSMASEIEEFGPGVDAERLRSEAVGIGMTLRDLATYCPDLFGSLAQNRGRN